MYDRIFPQIISNELWQKVAAINDDNKLAPSRKKEIYDYIISGKLVCGNFKKRMSGLSGTSKTGNLYFYYFCLSNKHRHIKCDKKPIRKDFIEDLVVNATASLLADAKTIRSIAKSIYAVHQKKTTDNSALKLLEKKRLDAIKAQNNMIKAIEQGIITESTKIRLCELEAVVA